MHRLQKSAVISALIACSVTAAGCGSAASTTGTSSSSTPPTTATNTGAGTLTHDEGTVTVTGNSVVLVDAKGAKHTFTIDPTLGAGQLAALAASGEKVRLFHRGNDAVRVEKAPTIQTTAKSVSGVISAVSPTAITLHGPGGAVTFVIRPADSAAFDVSHLREHQGEKSPIKVYYETKTGVKYALAYDDA